MGFLWVTDFLFNFVVISCVLCYVSCWYVLLPFHLLFPVFCSPPVFLGSPQFDCSPIPDSHHSCWHCPVPSVPCVPASVPCTLIGTLFCFSISLCILELPLSVFVLHVYGLTLSVLIRIFFCLNLTGLTTV